MTRWPCWNALTRKPGGLCYPERVKTLVVVATAAEAQHLESLRLASLPVRVIVSGVGASAAALATWRAITGESHTAPYDLVVSAGIGGAYPGSGLNPGDAAVSSQIIQADLGAQDGPDFLPLSHLGLSILPTREHFAEFGVWDGAADLAEGCGAAFGPTLSLNSVTGSAARAAQLVRLFPGALTEGMEGAGVAHAALLGGVPVLEVRGVSNPVGPRERRTWRIPEALAATRGVLEALLTNP